MLINCILAILFIYLEDRRVDTLCRYSVKETSKVRIDIVNGNLVLQGYLSETEMLFPYMGSHWLGPNENEKSEL